METKPPPNEVIDRDHLRTLAEANRRLLLENAKLKEQNNALRVKLGAQAE